MRGSSWTVTDAMQQAELAIAVCNPGCGAEVLDGASRNRNISIRHAVAIHPACPPGTLVCLLQDQDWTVAFEAARNANLPREDLRVWHRAVRRSA
jgi:hypothetical protein